MSDHPIKPCIYLITNTINGKKYVGQTIVSFKERMRKHELAHDGCTYLNRAVVKYGWENFKCEILFYCNMEQLNDYEKKFIALYNTCHGPGYNLVEGGMNGRLSNETKSKIGEGLKKFYASTAGSSMKRRRRKVGTIRFRKHLKTKPYQTEIMWASKTYHLGYYVSREEAQRAIDDFVKNKGN